MNRIDGAQRFALFALSGCLAITLAWWALALWPVSAAPDWLERTRYACFGTTADGLPDAGGWILLVGQPVSMLGFLFLVWGRSVVAGLRALATFRAGRGALRLCVLLLAAGVLLAGWRVAAAGERGVLDTEAAAAAPSHAERLVGVAPPLLLVDQRGHDFRLEVLRGRPVLVAFAWAHCETVCPGVVQDVLAARAAAREVDPVVVLVTLDPWRDTPTRLPAIARQWRLDDNDFVLSGEVDDVLDALAAWRVPIRRDPANGSVDHPAMVYIVDRTGHLAWVTAGGASRLAELLRQG